jgi:hypothetical protein
MKLNAYTKADKLHKHDAPRIAEEILTQADWNEKPGAASKRQAPKEKKLRHYTKFLILKYHINN